MTDHDNKDNPADWDACDIHESTYPRGGVCPECCPSDDIAQIRANIAWRKRRLGHWTKPEEAAIVGEAETLISMVETYKATCMADDVLIGQLQLQVKELREAQDLSLRALEIFTDDHFSDCDYERNENELCSCSMWRIRAVKQALGDNK
jgi:hypothetical protein